MAKVIAPNKQYTGLSATVMFVNGVGETDNENLLQWFEEKGYTVERPQLSEEEAIAALKTLIPPDTLSPLDKMTVAQLKEYAETNSIDLGEATKKEDILAAIQATQQPVVE